MYYLIASLQQIDAEIGGNLLAVLQSSQAAPLTELVVQLINQIAAAGKNVFLILDDYHLITALAVHQIVQLIIERQPPRMHTLILTREDPPFPLPRMRARGQVIEIRERDLRFTLPEAQAFLVEAMGLDLTGEDVGKLKERTEGWVAGMQLAALALEDFSDEEGRRAFIDAFTGSDRFIVDYLISEVLERQPEPIRQFLLATSVLERFCADLCDHVVDGGVFGSGRSQPILDGLEQANMFLVSSGQPASVNGTAITISSAKCSATPYTTPHPVRFRNCTAEPVSGLKRKGSPRRPSSTPWPRAIGIWWAPCWTAMRCAPCCCKGRGAW